MKKIATIVLLIVAALGAAAQNSSIYEGVYSPDKAVGTQPDAEYQLVRRQYTVNADGTTDYRYRKEVTIHRNHALTAYAYMGESFIVWNPDFETLKINECYTLRADGSRVDMPQNAFVEQLPHNCADCGRFNHLREMAVIHTGMEYGCTIVLDYTIHRQTDILEQRFLVPLECPVRKYEVIVDVPEGQYLSCGSTNRITYHNFTVSAEMFDDHTFHVVYHDVPATFNDAYLPEAGNLYPKVWFSNQSVPPLRYTPSNDVVPGLYDIAAELYESDGNKLAYIKRMRDYVIDNVRLNDIEPHQLNYRHASLTEVWNSNCGTLLEKASLLAALINEAGSKVARCDFNALVVPGVETVIDDFGLSNPAATVVRVSVDSLEYDLTLTGKGTPRLRGVAVNEVDTVSVRRTLDYKPVPLAGGYSKIVIPNEPGAFYRNPALLSAKRTAPMSIDIVNESYTYTVELPAGCKVVKPVSVKRRNRNLGNMEIQVSQQGSTLTVTRRLVLDRYHDFISADRQYRVLRQWLQEWEGSKTIVIK